jgi:hypothetical protein
MTRSSFRKLWLLSLATMMGITSYAYNSSEELNGKVSIAVRKKDKLNTELRMGNLLTASLATLDERTLDEKGVTRLTLMRYLGIEESSLSFMPQQAAEIRIGNTKVTTRDFAIRAVLPYSEALKQLDYFYNTDKVRINTITVYPSKEGFGDIVSLDLKGVVYGIRK